MMTPPDLDEVPAGLPREYLEPCLLLLLSEGPSHGYELLEQLREVGLTRVDPPALYRYLRAMDRSGLVGCWWEPSQVGPARRTYGLTDGGCARLQAWVSVMTDVHRTLGECLERSRQRAADEVGRR